MEAISESDPIVLDALQEDIYREKVRRAQAMTLSERLSAGLELFEETVGRMKVGVRLRHPDADELEVNRLLCEQLTRMQTWKERDLYRPVVGKS